MTSVLANEKSLLKSKLYLNKKNSSSSLFNDKSLLKSKPAPFKKIKCLQTTMAYLKVSIWEHVLYTRGKIYQKWLNLYSTEV